ILILIAFRHDVMLRNGVSLGGIRSSVTHAGCPYPESVMQSTIVKRSLLINGRGTSISLEDAFWVAFKRIAAQRNLTLSELAAEVDDKRKQGTLSSAVRVYILQYYCAGAVATA